MTAINVKSILFFHISMILCLLFLSQSSESIQYGFEPNEDMNKWGTIVTEETDAFTHNYAMKINPSQSITIFVQKDSTRAAQKVQFNWNKHGGNPAIFDLNFFIDNEAKSIENDKRNEWIKTNNFQMNNNRTHNLTWCFSLNDNWKGMRPKLWNSSCWIDNVDLNGSKIVGEQIINVTNVHIIPEKGELSQKYRYIVNFDGLDESNINSIRLDLSDASGVTRMPAKYPNYCNESSCEFDIDGFSLLDNYLGYIKYAIISNNLSLIEGNGPQIIVMLGEPKQLCKVNDGCSYIVSARSSQCPTNITLCYKDAEIWTKLETFRYNSCPEWKSFESINHPRYQAVKVVNGCECN